LSHDVSVAVLVAVLGREHEQLLRHLLDLGSRATHDALAA
jgi:hypothetical protein